MTTAKERTCNPDPRSSGVTRIPMTATETLRFQPYARLLTMLGDQLIKNERVALIEIIKNAYDADASWAKVTFDSFGENYKQTPASKIVIEDDGIGMTADILREHWVSPATPVKKLGKVLKDSTAKGRKIQGEKGIGRFALLKLGKKITITTRPTGSDIEYTLTLDLSSYDDEFLTKNGEPQKLFLTDLNVQLSSANATVIKSGPLSLGRRRLTRQPHGTRIEITHLRGSWTDSKVQDAYRDLVRLQSIFDQLDGQKASKHSLYPFEVAIYRNDGYEDFSDRYVSTLKNLMQNQAVLQITGGEYDETSREFRFSLNGRACRVPLNDPDITGLRLFRDHFGDSGEVLAERGTACGSFSFGFYVFDFSKDARGKHQLDDDDRTIIKEHRIYLYRDGIRVYPYGDKDDDWLQIDAYRGTISAGRFLSNDQVVGFVNITQQGNKELRDKTSREGLIDTGNAYSDFITLLQLFLAWVRKKPYATYRKTLEDKHVVEVFKSNAVLHGFDELYKATSNNKDLHSAVSQLSSVYKTERSYLVQRAETTEHLAGIGLSVETASHDIMAVMTRVLVTIDSLIRDSVSAGEVDKDVLNRDLSSLRGMLSFIEAQLKDLQLLFKSSKQRRRDLRVRELLAKVERLFKSSLAKDRISLQVEEIGPPLVAKSTDAVLLQLLLNLFDNAVYWLKGISPGQRKIRITLDGNESVLIFSDNGPGVKPEDAPYIFDAFYSGRGEDGRGLGFI